MRSRLLMQYTHLNCCDRFVPDLLCTPAESKFDQAEVVDSRIRSRIHRICHEEVSAFVSLRVGLASGIRARSHAQRQAKKVQCLFGVNFRTSVINFKFLGPKFTPAASGGRCALRPSSVSQGLRSDLDAAGMTPRRIRLQRAVTASTRL